MNVAFVFPDYGTQFVGMAKDVYDTSRTMQEYFEEASSCLDRNFVKLCFASSEVELSKIEHAYPALFLVSSALAAQVRVHGLEPSLVVGTGVGAYAALHMAHSITLPDGLYALSKLAHVLNEAECPGIHAPCARDVVSTYTMYLEKIDIRDAKMPCVFDGHDPIEDGTLLKHAIVNQLGTVARQNAMVFKDVDTLVCIGPMRGREEDYKALHPDKKCFFINSISDIETVTSYCAGLNDDKESL